MPFIKHEPIKQREICNCQEHYPPTHIVLDPGKHTYQCPFCGEITIVNVPMITF